jgi:radical SAM protein with 4Fe4S-binding SPASM domain
MIEELQLELTNRCNSKCIICPRNLLKREIGTMDEYFALNIIDNAIKCGVKTVKLEWFGETLLVPYWNIIALYIKNNGLKLNLITNCSLLNFINRNDVLSLIDKVFISIDSCEKEEYEKIRIGLTFDKVLSNLKSLFKERNNGGFKTKIIVSMVSDSNKCVDFFKKYSDDVIVNKNINIKYDGKKRDVKCLHNVDKRFVVGWDGKCYLCCHDWIGEYFIGDLTKESIEDIWNGEKRKNFINNLNDLEICQKCVMSAENIK